MKKENKKPVGPGTAVEAPPTLEIQTKTAAEKYIEAAKEFVVTADTRTTAIEKLSEIKKAWEIAEAERDKKLEKPAEQVKEIKTQWKPALDFFEEADEILRAKVKAHDKAVKDAAKANLAKLDAKIEAGTIVKPETIQKNTAAILGTLAPRTTQLAGGGGSQTRQNAIMVFDDNQKTEDDHRVAGTKIPDKYWKLDTAALRKDVITQKLLIPGVKLDYEDTLAIF